MNPRTCDGFLSPPYKGAPGHSPQPTQSKKFLSCPQWQKRRRLGDGQAPHVRFQT